MNDYMKSYLLLALPVILATSCTKQLSKDNSLSRLPSQKTAVVAADPLSYTRLERIGSIQLSKVRTGITLATAGGYVFFAGGMYTTIAKTNTIPARDTAWADAYATVDILDTQTGLMSQTILSQPRCGMAAAVVGNKVLFAGGVGWENIGGTQVERTYATVDIYDIVTKQWSSATLSVARSEIAATSVGSKAYFAGGLDTGATGVSKVIDVYDAATGQWSTMQLRDAKRGAAAVTRGNEIIFAGGGATTGDGTPMQPSNSIEIYNVSTGAWSYSSVGHGKRGMNGVVLDNKVFLAGGLPLPFDIPSTGETKVMEVFSQPGVAHTFIDLNEERPINDAVAVGVGNFVVVASGQPSTTASTATAYYYPTGQVSSIALTIPGENSSMVAVGNRVYIAGGRALSGTELKVTHTDVVDVLELKP